MKNYIKEEVIEFLAEKESIREKFLRYVQDSNQPILERLSVWEDHATDILPLGNWLSQTPIWLRSEAEHLDRYTTHWFIDLAEAIQSKDDTQISFYDSGRVAWLSDEAIESLEEVFNIGLCGTHVDW